MARLKLTFEPDKILRNKNLDITFPLSKDMRELIDQMVFACKKFKGVGLAAPQIGKNLNLAIINLDLYELPAFAIINPKIVKFSKETDAMEEGCLSIPDIFGQVTRPSKVKAEFYNSEGKKISFDLDGFTAKVFQHEIDHLNQVLIKDKWDTATVHKVDEEWKKQHRKARKKSSSHGPSL